MDPVAQYALTGSIVASAVGGIALCVLVMLFGFLPPEDEPAVAARRRIFATRLGHTVAAVCFAATALLAVVVLSRQAPGVAGSRGFAELAALEARVSAVERLVERIAASMETLLSRIRQGGDESASPSTTREGRSGPGR